jgi:hypothetical protein
MKSEEHPTIYLLHTNDHTHYKAMFPVSHNQAPSKQFGGKSLSDIKRELIDQLITELHGMKFEDLKLLYSYVSKSLRERNGLVADFNVLLTSLLSCNTNSLFLGSVQQSKGALFYIGPYICKNGVQIIDSFDLLIKAQDYAMKYPSVTEDSSTSKRFVQYIMTRVINKMNSLMEVSDTQAAAALLGMDAGMCSDIFTSFDANSHLQYVYDEKMKSRYGCDDDEQELMSCDTSDDDGSLDSFIVHDDTDTECEEDENSENVCHQQNESIMINEGERDEADCLFEMSGLEGTGYLGTGYCPIYKVDNGKRLAAVPNTKLYSFRGAALADLSRFEYETQKRFPFMNPLPTSLAYSTALI